MALRPKWSPEDLFDEEPVQEYERRVDLLWHDLVRANSSLYVVNKVADFPTWFAPTPDDQIFLQLVVRNFLDQVVLVSANAFTDKNPRSVSFPTLKDWMLGHSRQGIRDELSAYLAHVEPGDDTIALLDKAKTVRHKIIAHLDWDLPLDAQRMAEMKLSLPELQRLLDHAESMFSALYVGPGRSMLPPPYSEAVEHPSGMDPRSDVERLLDVLAADSAFLRAPDEQKEVWPYHAKSLTHAQREEFNYWRRRVGLAEVPFD